MPGATTRTSPAASSRGPRRVRQLIAVCAPAPLPRSVVTLDGAAITLGREAALVLPDGEVSRLHARVEPDGDGWAVVDCGSRNGVRVGGEKVARAVLAPGSVIRLGASIVVYAEHELEDALPLVGESPTLLGGSVAMQQVRGAIELVAPRAIPVLVRGETGVGKERVAEAVHRASGRAGAWIAVNCAAIAAGLADSELFGHVAGAFTGATAKSDGLFAAADRGTLFLDEIAELPEPIQAKLLRAIAAGEVRPVGATAARTVDVRVIAATHVDLEDAVASGEFRADLLARLAAWTIRIPPLRARREDILRLAGDAALDADVAERLLLHDWPGNVRDLEHVLARAGVLAQGGAITVEHLPAALRGADGPPGELPLALAIDRTRAPGRDQLERVLAHFDGRVTEVARFFGKSRRQLYRWMKDLGLDPATYRGDDDAGA